MRALRGKRIREDQGRGAWVLLLAGAVVGLLLLVTAPGAGASVENCSPTPKTAGSFCVDYGLELSNSIAASPVAIDLSAADTSTNFSSDFGTWVDHLDIAFSGTDISPPIITPSASMPDGLLIAGGPPCTAPAFTDCSAGYGVFAVHVTQSPCGPCVSNYQQGTFGITKVVNIADAGPGNRAKYRVDIEACSPLQPFLTASCAVHEIFSEDLPVPDYPDAAGSGTGNFQVPTSYPVSGDPCNPGCPYQGTATLQSLTLHLEATSSTLEDGSPAGQSYPIVRVPDHCGSGTASADAVSADARSVSFGDAISVSGCPTAGLSAAPAGFAAHLDGGGSTTPLAPSRSIAEWRWDFGDGQSQITSGPTLDHTFKTPGDHTVGLTVVDSAGAFSPRVNNTVHGSSITAKVKKKRKSHKIKIKGQVTPAQPGEKVALELQRKKGRSFKKVGSSSPAQKPSGAFKASFHRPRHGRCRLVATFAGDAQVLGSTTTHDFGC